MAFTYFFRDLQILHRLRDQLECRLQDTGRLAIWDAGCAYGQEPYSLAIALRQVITAEQFVGVRILATDIDSSGRLATTVRQGCYSHSQIQRIPEAVREIFFAPLQDDALHYELRGDIRAAVTFQRHDLCTLQAPGDPFDAIVCKNVLLHLSAEQRTDVMRMFHGALRPGGLLATEQTQKLPAPLTALFEPLAGNVQIHRKLSAAVARPGTTVDRPSSLSALRGQHAAAPPAPGYAQLIPRRADSAHQEA